MNTENAFKKIENSEREVPSELKKKVMNDIAIAKSIIEFSELFTDNIPNAIMDMLKSNQSRNH
ncbi:MAG: hypothetical protein ABR597_11460 [Bacteroidales bacterium]